MKNYVTYDPQSGELTGGYLQEVQVEHTDIHVEVSPSVRMEWVRYQMNESRDGVELRPFVEVSLDYLKSAKNSEIDGMRAAANASTFPYAGKQIACDSLSRSDIDGVANHIALFGAFPLGFPGGWKATDKSMLPLSDVDSFRAMYAAMAAQGTENFNHSQELKARLAVASTPEEIAAIEW